MRLATFTANERLAGEPRLGAQTDAGMVDLRAGVTEVLARRMTAERARTVAAATVPPEMVGLLETGSLAAELAAEAVQLTVVEGGGVLWLPEQVRLQAPLRPRTIREFSVYEEHVAWSGQAPAELWYAMPLYWKGNPNATFGPDDVVPFPAFTEMLDFELEIAAVIGKAGRDIDPADALDHVAGFTIFNDISARDIQLTEMAGTLGPAKGKDFCNVFGPVIVTPDELGDPCALPVAVSVNGERLAENTTANMQHSWAALIAHASKAEQLVPGDVLTSGTIGRCCMLEHAADPTVGPMLREGDVLELRVDGIGTLRNVVGRPADGPDIAYASKGRLPGA
ncbi:MAG: fumarylacetoacetate hydrolase family protein [Patulibacter sp.]|nr:fumarylacetoacetate hydrolase family protein [Patulibacter sp.]